MWIQHDMSTKYIDSARTQPLPFRMTCRNGSGGQIVGAKMTRRKTPDRRPQGRAVAHLTGRRTGAGRPVEVWLFGLHTVRAALANPDRQWSRLVVAEGSNAAKELGQHKGAELVPRVALQQVLPPGAVHQGVALLASPLEPATLDDLCADPSGFVVVLDQVTDPHNIGAIVRSCAGFGARAVVVTERQTPATSGTLAKSASGGLEHVDLVPVTNLARALDALGHAGYWRLGLEAGTERTLTDPRPDGPLVLVLGAEGTGLRRLTKEQCDELASIALAGKVASLNVSNAAAVALYELCRP